MKKRIKLLCLLLFMFMFIPQVYALSCDKTNIIIERGKSETVNLYASVEEEITKLDFTLIYHSNSFPAEYFASDLVTDTTPNESRHVLNLNEPKSGKILLGYIRIDAPNNGTDNTGSINVSKGVAYTVDSKEINLNSFNVNVFVSAATPTPTPKPIDKNMLSKIESKYVAIDLKKDIFNYYVTIDEDVLELDLKPIAVDDDVKIDVSTQVIKDIKDNKIIIKTSKEDTESVYTINFDVKKKEKKIVIDTTEFEEDKSFKTKWTILIGLLVISIIGCLIINKLIKKR